MSSMLKEAEIGFWIQELDKWEIIWANDKLSSILKIEHSNIIGRDIRNFFNEETVTFLHSHSSYKPKIFRTKGIGKGNRIDIQVAVGTVEDKYLYGVISDITLQQQSYCALRASEKRFKSLIEATRAGITIINPEGVIVFANPSFANLLGFESPQTLIGKDISEFINEIEILLPIDEFTKLKLVQKDGKRKDILISVDPVISGVKMSEYVGVIANLPEDIAKSLKREKLCNEFLQITVHEMATPISLIKGFTELLLKNFNQEQGFDEVIIDSLLRNTKKLERQIITLRDAQEAKDGIFSIVKKLISFEEFKTFLISDIDILREKSRIKLELNDSRDTHDIIQIDPDRMAQVIFNLVENGCHHSPKTEDVILKVSLTNNNLEIRVLDNGVGFSEEKIRKVFQPFFSESTEYYKKGMGLGLYITQTIVHKHGGNITLKSKNGKGSEFIISIPV